MPTLRRPYYYSGILAIVKIGKSESRENLSSDEGTFSQEYFVYFKKK